MTTQMLEVSLNKQTTVAQSYRQEPKASDNGLTHLNSMESSSIDRESSFRIKTRLYGTSWEVDRRCMQSCWRKFFLVVLVVTVISQWAEMPFVSPQAEHVAAKDSFQRNGAGVTTLSRQLGPNPWTVFLEGSPWINKATQTVVLYPLMKGDRSREKNSTRRIFDPNCEYIYDWQMTFHPTCNEFHATNLADVLVDKRAELLGEGWWRQGWKMTNPRTATNAIWKTSQ
jgi:hypothetical protein